MERRICRAPKEGGRQSPVKVPVAGCMTEKRSGRRDNCQANPKSRPMCTCSPSNHAGSFQCSHHKLAVSGEKMRRCRRRADREILRRALAPPVRRSNQPRWLNFQPTPSRLCNMSMA
uniref:Uncharacterized protein n=1 Tax=Nelumbo nucifera TaxID=4432 RepID=A0A822XRP0_NELNU|nr:TPA_asm: hypothetical protein HUJ06_024450 [Nelumbo nucifera]